MTDLYPVTAVATGVLGLVAGTLVPRLIASVPEPEPEPQVPEAAEAENDPEEPKELYADIAARPGMLWKCALASAVSAASMGLVLGWSCPFSWCCRWSRSGSRWRWSTGGPGCCPPG